jgi:hypothetical protein
VCALRCLIVVIRFSLASHRQVSPVHLPYRICPTAFLLPPPSSLLAIMDKNSSGWLGGPKKLWSSITTEVSAIFSEPNAATTKEDGQSTHLNYHQSLPSNLLSLSSTARVLNHTSVPFDDRVTHCVLLLPMFAVVLFRATSWSSGWSVLHGRVRSAAPA